jgi:uncharacterized protein (TIRG00374 family)
MTRQRWRRRARLVLGFAVATAAVWLALRAAGGPSKAASVLGRTRPGWLAGAVAAQVLGFGAAAVRLQRLVGGGRRLGLGDAVWLELAMNGLWVLAPAAPAEGLAYGAAQLRRRGLERPRTALALGLEQWFTFRVVYLVASTNLLVVLATRDFPVGGPWPPLAAVAVLLLLAWTAVLARRPTSLERVSRVLMRLRFWAPRPSLEQQHDAAASLHEAAMALLGPPTSRMRLVALSLASHAGGVLTLMLSLRAVGVAVDLDLVLLCSALAVVVSSVPLLPAGLGTVEASVPALLHWYGVPLAPALAGAVVARVVGTVLPALGGALALLVLRDREPAELVAAERTGP